MLPSLSIAAFWPQQLFWRFAPLPLERRLTRLLALRATGYWRVFVCLLVGLRPLDTGETASSVLFENRQSLPRSHGFRQSQASESELGRRTLRKVPSRYITYEAAERSEDAK